MIVLANDGIAASGQAKLEAAGHTVLTTKVAQEQLADFINSEKVDVLLVRSATTARAALIDACPGLKMIGRGGVGMDNIDVDYAAYWKAPKSFRRRTDRELACGHP